MSRTTPSGAWAAALVLALACPPAEAQDPGFADLAEGGSPAPSRATFRVPDFDPARDVPAMANWVPDTEFQGGAAHCFAMSMLTYYVWRRVEFVDAPGVPAPEWTPDTPGDTPLAMDEDGLLLAMEWAFESRDRKIRIGGARDLREATREGTETEALFRRIAEALQFSMQIPTNIGRYMRNIAFGGLDVLPGERFTAAGVNRRAHDALRARLAAGKLAPFTAHPAAPRTDGHVLVAYAYRDLGDRVELDLYDSNYPPVGDRARPGTLVFDPEDWSYALRNHAGRAVYTRYELITPLKPDRAYERQVFWRIVTHLDEYLAANEWVFERLAEGQDAWEYLSRDAVRDLRRRTERARERARSLRERLFGR